METNGEIEVDRESKSFPPGLFFLMFIFIVACMGKFGQFNMPGYNKAVCAVDEQSVRFVSVGTGYEYTDEERILAPGHPDAYYGSHLTAVGRNEDGTFSATFRGSGSEADVVKVLPACQG